MSQVFSPILIIVFGGLVAVVISILAIQQMAGLDVLNTQSVNLVSTSTSMSSFIPIIGLILVVGVLGSILARKS